MNNMILAGCMLTYSSVFLLGLDGRLVSGQVFPLVCSVNLTDTMPASLLLFEFFFHSRRAAGWVRFGQKWKARTGRQYFADIVGLSSTTVT